MSDSSRRWGILALGTILVTCLAPLLSACEGDPIWTDKATGLTWQVTPPANQMSWSEANTYCAELDLEGAGWRLPTINELRSLIRGCYPNEIGGSCKVDADECSAWSCANHDCPSCGYFGGPTNDGCYWPEAVDGDCSIYWSSTTLEDYEEDAWDVWFHHGNVENLRKEYDENVRCVR